MADEESSEEEEEEVPASLLLRMVRADIRRYSQTKVRGASTQAAVVGGGISCHVRAASSFEVATGQSAGNKHRIAVCYRGAAEEGVVASYHVGLRKEGFNGPIASTGGDAYTVTACKIDPRRVRRRGNIYDQSYYMVLGSTQVRVRAGDVSYQCMATLSARGRGDHRMIVGGRDVRQGDDRGKAKGKEAAHDTWWLEQYDLRVEAMAQVLCE